MQEELISYTTAKLAKEKGFDVSVNTYYDLSNVFTKDKKSLSEYTIPLDYNSRTKSPQFEERCYISRPTQTLLQKWLREVHNIKLWNEFGYTNEWFCYYLNKYDDKIQLTTNLRNATYEEALEVGLYQALLLLQ